MTVPNYPNYPNYQLYHRSLKERVLLVVHTVPWDLVEDIGALVAYYNRKRYRGAGQCDTG